MDLIIFCISLSIFTLLIFSGVAVPVSFLGTILFIISFRGLDPSFLLPAGFAKINSVTLLTLPFFIALGYIVTGGSIASRLIRFINLFTGKIRGGLGVVAVVVSACFGAIAGAASSSVIAVGTIMIPQMEKNGYPREYSTSLISSAAVLATLIPPSLPMIMFAFVGNVSVAGCFLATVGPGILLMTMFCICNLVMVRRYPTIKVDPAYNFRNVIKTFPSEMKNVSWALMLPVMILGGIYAGIMTPTEAAGMSVIYAIALSMFIYKEMSFQKVLLQLRISACTTGTMMMMTYFAAVVSRVYTMEQVPQLIAATLLGISSNKYIILLMVNIFFLFIGMIMDEMSGILLTTPLLMPVMVEIGIDPLHFAAIAAVNLGMGMMVPPVAAILYIGARVGNVTVDQMARTSLMLILFGSIPVILITTYWPDLALFLPRLAGFTQ